MRDGNNTIIAQGGEFGEEEESEFGMVGGLSVGEVDLGQLNIYPNPTNGIIFIDVEKVDLVSDSKPHSFYLYRLNNTDASTKCSSHSLM